MSRGLFDQERRAERQEAAQLEDRGVLQTHAPVRRAPRNEVGLVGAVDADHASTGPVRQPGRVRSRAESEGAVDPAEALELLADPEAAARRGSPALANADARLEDLLPPLVESGGELPAVDHQLRAHDLELGERLAW